MATKLSTKQLSLRNARLFANSFFVSSDQNVANADIQYIFIGNSIAYSNEASPPDIVESISDTNDALNSIIAMKRVEADDVNLVIPRINWTSNTKYHQYDTHISLDTLLEENTLLNTKPMYVITSARNVYKCLSNNQSANSTIEPTGDFDTSNGLFSTSDGYIWKYMYNVRDGNDFIDTNNIPVPSRNIEDMTDTTPYGEYGLRNSAVKEGEITTVVVTNSGSNYRDHTNVLTSSFSTGDTSLEVTAAFLESVENVSLSDIAAANMSVTGSQFETDTFIVTANSDTNIVTLSKPTISPSDGTSSNAVTFKTRVFFDGITSDVTATANANTLGGLINSITVGNFGVGYADKVNVKIFGTGTGATGRVVIPPVFGHGFDLAKDLGANSVCAIAKFGDIDSTENGLVPTDTVFRQIGLLRKPYKYNTNNSTAFANTINASSASATVSQVTKVFVASGSAYTLGEFVFQGTSNTNYTAAGFVSRIASLTQIELTKVIGDFAEGAFLTGETSGSSRLVTQVVDPSFDPKSSELLFVENITPVTRTEGQAENVRLVLKF